MVFDDRFEMIFEFIEKYTFLIFGSFKNDDYCLSYILETSCNLRKEVNNIGYKIKNMNVNSGIVGRAGDEMGRVFGKTLDMILIENPLLNGFPKGYFNDEPYFMIAFQLVVQGTDKGKLGLSKGTY